MSKLKITVHQLKNYLGTGLECEHYGELLSIRNWIGWCAEFKDKTGSVNIPISVTRPICYRLSDLDKEIVHNGELLVPLYELMDEFDFVKDDVDAYGLDAIPFGCVQDLIKLHFWPFGDSFFDEGLVIDKMKHVL